jgi:hypothetical protein
LAARPRTALLIDLVMLGISGRIAMDNLLAWHGISFADWRRSRGQVLC